MTYNLTPSFYVRFYSHTSLLRTRVNEVIHRRNAHNSFLHPPRSTFSLNSSLLRDLWLNPSCGNIGGWWEQVTSEIGTVQRRIRSALLADSFKSMSAAISSSPSKLNPFRPSRCRYLGNSAKSQRISAKQQGIAMVLWAATKLAIKRAVISPR